MCRSKVVFCITAITLSTVLITAHVVAQTMVRVHAAAPRGSGPGASRPPLSYLGVGLRDVTDEQMTALHLHEARGAEIVMVDHDGPAGTAGLHAHDVVLQMNGQTIEGEEQLRRMLRETPPGHTVTLVIWREGQQQTISALLANRAEIERRAWEQHFVVPDPDGVAIADDDPVPTALIPHGFLGNHLSLGSSGYTGLMLDAMEPQLATYFGARDGHGLLVKTVEPASPAAIAGVRAGDVVLRLNGASITTRSEWLRAMHNAKGKTVAVTLLRDRREITLTMSVDTKKHGELTPLPVPDGNYRSFVA